MTPRERKEYNIKKANEDWIKRKEEPARGNSAAWRALADRSYNLAVAQKIKNEREKY